MRYKFSMLAGLLASEVSGCRTLQLADIARIDFFGDLNSGHTFNTTLRFGVADLAMYQYSNVFGESTIVHFPESMVKFPCFNDTALFIYVR